NIDAVEFNLLVWLSVERLLIENGIERNCGLSGLTVSDDQLALATSNRDQRVNGFQTGGHRLVHRFVRNNPGGFPIDARSFLKLYRTLPINRISESVNHATKQALAYRYVDNRASAFDRLTFLDFTVVAKNNDANIINFKIERHAAHAVFEFNQLAGLYMVEAVNACDAVTDGKHVANFGYLGFLTKVFDLLFQNGGNFCGADIHQRASFIASLIELSLVRSELSTMRLPTLTISPPMIAGSILTSRSMSLPPVTDLSAVLSASRFLSLSFSATVTCAVTSPL